MAKADCSGSPAGQQKVEKYRYIPSVRMAVGLLLFLGNFTSGINFHSLDVSITCMINSSYLNDSGSVHDSNRSAVGINNLYEGTFGWDRRTQSYLFSGHSWGSASLVFLGSWLCDRYGIKGPYITALAIYTMTAIIIPSAANLSWIALFCTRVMQGAALVVNWPAVLVASNVWSPVDENSVFISLAISGNKVGGFFANFVNGVICKTVPGWQSAFYIFGVFSGITTLLWWIFYSNKVSEAMFISKNEVDYIIKTRRGVTKTHTKTPWLALITSLPIWAIFVANMGNSYWFYALTAYLPTYYKEVMKLNPTNNGIISSLSGVSQLIGYFISAFTADYWQRRRSQPTVSVKVYSAICGFLPSILMTAMTLLGEDEYKIAIAMILLSFLFDGFMVSGYMKSTCCVAPEYTGRIAGISQTGAEIAAIIAAYSTGAMTPNGTIMEWHTAMYVACALAALGTLFFIIFGSGEPVDLSWSPRSNKVGAKQHSGANTTIAVTIASKNITKF